MSRWVRAAAEGALLKAETRFTSKRGVMAQVATADRARTPAPVTGNRRGISLGLKLCG